MSHSFHHLLFLLSCLPILTVFGLVVGPNATVNSMVYSGNGCPQGSSYFQLTETRMIMSFEQFEMYIGPGTKPVDHSKNCKVVWDMRVDAGYKYRINGVGTEIRGWKALDTGAVLTFVGTYSFTGGLAGEESNARIQITGPQSGDAPFTGKGTPNPVGGITSPCGGGVLNAWYRLSLTTLNNPVGELPIDRDEHPLHIMPSLEWLEC